MPRPLRCAVVVPAPAASVRRVLAGSQVWVRALRSLGLRCSTDAGPTLTTGTDLHFRSDLRLATDTARLTVTGTDEQGLPVLAVTLGRLTRADLRIRTAETGAGVLTTLDLRITGPDRYTPYARRRLIRFGQAVLGVATVTARDPQVVVAGAVFRDGTVLAARRARPEALAGLWEMPGGRVEPGETEPVALRRELAEELGITVRVGERIEPSAQVGPGLVLHPWTADWTGGEPRPMEADPAHDEVRWLRADQLDEVDWLPGDAPFVEAVRALLTVRAGAARTDTHDAGVEQPTR
ncbi:NUDIX domain-containing protein [Nakamurella sp. YIM 132087]|uniref:8-oxo-dGTP diphosphatase n=1 Tax=Nakamurella alba TaxID=2665158 RepID=A0A7K1FFN2_9ACTN|nr:(deoxy)nucleoside triphosphate pyrophosphohydrolase [Nakamurella alba]MTD12918.1 NUDIX domain-containing protein [Nakamurella alba]